MAVLGRIYVTARSRSAYLTALTQISNVLIHVTVQWLTSWRIQTARSATFENVNHFRRAIGHKKFKTSCDINHAGKRVI